MWHHELTQCMWYQITVHSIEPDSRRNPDNSHTLHWATNYLQHDSTMSPGLLGIYQRFPPSNLNEMLCKCIKIQHMCYQSFSCIYHDPPDPREPYTHHNSPIIISTVQRQFTHTNRATQSFHTPHKALVPSISQIRINSLKLLNELFSSPILS